MTIDNIPAGKLQQGFLVSGFLERMQYHSSGRDSCLDLKEILHGRPLLVKSAQSRC